MHKHQTFTLPTTNRFQILTTLDESSENPQGHDSIVVLSSDMSDSSVSESDSSEGHLHLGCAIDHPRTQPGHSHSKQLTTTDDLEPIIISSNSSPDHSPTLSPIHSPTPSPKSSSSDSDNTTQHQPHKHESYPAAIETNKLPYDIDGFKVYKLPYDPQNRMKSTKDGRPWKTWVTTSRKGFSGTRRLAHCNGGSRCKNGDCMFKKQYGHANTTQFNRDGTCKCCGQKGLSIKCSAVKVWEFPRNSNKVIVYHRGKHTCTAINKTQTDYDQVEQVFQANPTIKPSQAAKTGVMSALKAGKSVHEARKIADAFMNMKKVRNIKQRVRSELYPTGHNFEALAHLKARMDQEDPLYIYKMNDRRHNSKPSFVFKASKIQAQLALAMDRDSNEILNNEYCFVDIKHNRCASFKTLAAHVYHPLLRRMVTLATMECENEVSETIALFWTNFNELLQKVSGIPNLMFNPIGWMADEAGANWAGLRDVFGPSVISRTVSCQFHYMQSVNKHAQKLNSSKSQVEFKELARGLMKSDTLSWL